MRKLFLIPVLMMLCLLDSYAQSSSVPRNYFRNPLNIKFEIVSNFGELRPNHWHMGLDIRTQQKENIPVHAAAEGYIAQIGVRPSSFGRFIVINHPNGLSTLYAHLNDFFPDLEKYVTAKQYENESWAIELSFGPGQFKVSKGQFIAYSGNTGGSQGPHLHFEIFDTKTQKRLNPQLFNFPLPDQVPPDLVRLAIYDRSQSIFNQTPELFTLKKTDSGYIIPKMPVIKTGLTRLSFAMQMHDRQSGSNNPNGVFSAQLNADDIPQVKFVLDSIDYSETSYMNAHIDFPRRYEGGSYLQHLSKLPGDLGVAYKNLAGDGVIELNDTIARKIQVRVADAQANVSVLTFYIQFSESLYNHNAYRRSERIPPLNEFRFEKPEFSALIKSTSLYDTLYPSYNEWSSSDRGSISKRFKLNDASIPVHGDITIRIKPNTEIDPQSKDKIVIRRIGKGSTVRKAQWDGNEWIKADFGDFGEFQAFIDNEPPVINNLGGSDTINLSASKRIVFTPTDNTVVRKFRATIDGRWIRFTNDKGRNWIYDFDERVPFGTYLLKVEAEDIAGNISTREWWFKRGPYTPPKKKAPVKKKSTKKKTVTKKK